MNAKHNSVVQFVEEEGQSKAGAIRGFGRVVRRYWYTYAVPPYICGGKG